MKGYIEKPFAHCCAEGGGRVEYCDCVNKDHGTAWFAPTKDERAALAATSTPPASKGVGA